MLKVLFTLLVLASVGLAQSSSDGAFSVRHSKHANFSLSPTEMREAESLYQSACAAVQHDFRNAATTLRPRFTVVIGEDRNEVVGNTAQATEVHRNAEIRMKKWNPIIFAQGVVVLAFDQMLTGDVIRRLGDQAVRYSNATVDVAGLR
jgi:hypothetical protein